MYCADGISVWSPLPVCIIRISYQSNKWSSGSICFHFQVEVFPYSDSLQGQVPAPLCSNLIFGKVNILALTALKKSTLNIQFLAHSMWYLNINKTFGVMWANFEEQFNPKLPLTLLVIFLRKMFYLNTKGNNK